MTIHKTPRQHPLFVRISMKAKQWLAKEAVKKDLSIAQLVSQMVDKAMKEDQ